MQMEIATRFAHGLASAGTWCTFPMASDARLVGIQFKHHLGARPVRQSVKGSRISDVLVSYVRAAKTGDDAVSRLTDVLEFELYWVVILEEASALGLKSIGELKEKRDQLRAIATRRVGEVGWKKCIRECLVRDAFRKPGGADTTALPSLSAAAERLDWMLRNPELETLRTLATETSPTTRARFERSLASMRALIARERANDPQYRLVGSLFEAGQIDVAQVAALLQMSVPDALVFLEENGWHRPITRKFEGRAEVLRKLRALREAGSRWWNTSELARRNALSTQRIESIDARQH